MAYESYAIYKHIKNHSSDSLLNINKEDFMNSILFQISRQIEQRPAQQ